MEGQEKVQVEKIFPKQKRENCLWKVTQGKNIMTSFAAGDPMEQLHNELLEVLGKVEYFTNIIFHLWHFLDHIIKTLGMPPQLTWMDKIKKDDDLYPL